QVGSMYKEYEQIEKMSPNKLEFPLDTVMKYEEDDNCYAVNYDTRMRAPLDWRDEKRAIPPGCYIMRVRLQWSEGRSGYLFLLRNPGATKRVMLEQFDPSSIPDMVGSQP